MALNREEKEFLTRTHNDFLLAQKAIFEAQAKAWTGAVDEFKLQISATQQAWSAELFKHIKTIHDIKAHLDELEKNKLWNRIKKLFSRK